MEIWLIFAITAILADFAVKAEVGADGKPTRFCQDDKSREKYCQSANPDDIELCLRCVFQNVYLLDYFLEKLNLK